MSHKLIYDFRGAVPGQLCLCSCFLCSCRFGLVFLGILLTIAHERRDHAIRLQLRLGFSPAYYNMRRSSDDVTYTYGVAALAHVPCAPSVGWFGSYSSEEVGGSLWVGMRALGQAGPPSKVKPAKHLIGSVCSDSGGVLLDGGCRFSLDLFAWCPESDPLLAFPICRKNIKEPWRKPMQQFCPSASKCSCLVMGSFSRKLCEGFLVKKRPPCTHHYTYTAHLHCATAFAHIAPPAPLTYITPQHSHRLHTARYCTHHYTYTAHLHRATAFAHIAFTSPSIFSFCKTGVGSSGIVGAHPLRVSCASHRSRCGAVRILKTRVEPSAGIVRVESLPLWRRANFENSRRTLCGDRACRIAPVVAPCQF